ncbi:MAG: methionyl-tRNA formyltransferase [Synergistaceae bacterium]|nr:methionyl-tRNA formyltransferase [Synergistaceae bacterium]
MNGGLRFEKIITGEPTQAGRGLRERVSAVERAAGELGLAVERTGPLRSNEPLKNAMISEPPDLVFVIDFAQMIGEPFLNGPKHGCLNVHPSLLPRWRGAAPVQRAILSGDTAAGVTVFRLVKEMDAGPILAQTEISLPVLTDSSELFQTLAFEGSQIAIQSVNLIISGSYHYSEQNSKLVTYAAKLDKEEARILWDRDGLSVHNTVRAFASSFGAFVMVAGKRLKVWRTAPDTGEGAPGTVLCLTGGDPLVACGKGAVRLMEVQNEGKRRVSGAEWFRGTRLKEGDVLTTLNTN